MALSQLEPEVLKGIWKEIGKANQCGWSRMSKELIEYDVREYVEKHAVYGFTG